MIRPEKNMILLDFSENQALYFFSPFPGDQIGFRSHEYSYFGQKSL